MKKLLLLILLLPTLSFAELNSFLCIAEGSGGLIYNKATKKLEGTKFKTETKLVVRETEDYKWSVKQFGSDFELAYNGCDERIFENKRLYLVCDIYGGQLVFHIKELRFVKTYTAGYIIEPDTTTFDTPHIEAGDCSQI